MGRMKKIPETKSESLGRPALTPEARENQLISLAYDLAEQHLRDGTATSQEVVHFLRLGSTRERMEKEMLTEQMKLTKAKAEAIEEGKRIEELYSNAIAAMRRYQGVPDEPDEEVIQ